MTRTCVGRGCSCGLSSVWPGSLAGEAMTESGRSLIEVSCRNCDFVEACDAGGMGIWLRRAKMLRPTSQLSEDEMRELLPVAVAKVVCPECGAETLSIGEPAESAGDWQDAPTCEQCGVVIPAERVAALGGTKLCVSCQQDDEAGAAGEAEYCPRCGAVMRTQLAGGAGIARYVTKCGDCGYVPK